MPDSPPPTLFAWAGGQDALERLTARFYQHVAAEPLLAPLFPHLDAHHPRFVVQFIAEVFVGPASSRWRRVRTRQRRSPPTPSWWPTPGSPARSPRRRGRSFVTDVGRNGRVKLTGELVGPRPAIVNLAVAG